MIAAWEAAVAVSTSCAIGEGPWWDTEQERLLWVDITAGRIHAHAPATGAGGATEFGGTIGFVVGRDGGGFIAGTGSGLVALDDELRPRGLVAAPPDLDGTRRINDGIADPRGRVLFGTVDPTGRGTGSLWRVDPDGACTAVADGLLMSNGLALSPDARQLYLVDSLRRSVHRFPYDPATGEVSEPTTLIRLPDTSGLPDGLAVDSRGRLWLAVWGTGEIWQVTADGARIGIVRAGAARTTSCAFGAGRLYITSARDGASRLDDPDRDEAPGALFVADVGTDGARVWTAAAPEDAAW